MIKTKNGILVATLVIVTCLFVGMSNAFAKISEQEAVSIALNAIKTEYDRTDEDMEEYALAEATFRQANNSSSKEWFILFAGTAEHPEFSTDSYAVYLNSDGTMKQICPPTIHNTVFDAYDDLCSERGMFVTWTIEQKYEFEKTFSQKISDWLQSNHPAQEEEISPRLFYLTSKNFQLPMDDDIDFSFAKECATNALLAQEGAVDFEKFNQICTSFMKLPTGETVWRIFFIPVLRRDTDCGYRVDIDSKTGQTVEILHQYAYDSDWASQYE